MRTYNGKHITKKHIVEVLRTKNVTAIFKLYHMIYGGRPHYLDIIGFAREYAPSQRLYAAISEAIEQTQRDPYSWDEAKKSMAFNTANGKHIAVQAVREFIQDPHSPYAKRPIMGNKHLWFTSPVYQHSDYNKWRSIQVSTMHDRHFCEVICRLADKYYNQ